MKANPVLAATDLPLDEQGPDQVRVPTCASTGVDDAWAAGDNAAVPDLTPRPRARLRPNAQHAVRQAKVLGRQHRPRVCAGKPAAGLPAQATSARSRSLGLHKGVAQVYGVKLQGLPGLVHAPHLPPVAGCPPSTARPASSLDWTLALFFRREVVSLGSLHTPVRRVPPSREQLSTNPEPPLPSGWRGRGLRYGAGMADPQVILPTSPILSLDAYLAAGGGDGLAAARRLGPEATHRRGHGDGPAGPRRRRLPDRAQVGVGARGRAAAGATSWPTAPRASRRRSRTGTLMRRDPYRIVEGAAIAALAVGATEVYLATKRSFTRRGRGPAAGRGRAAARPGLLGELTVTIVEGPDEYLFGEEKALLEVIEGRDPLPRAPAAVAARPVRHRASMRLGGRVASRATLGPRATRPRSTTSRPSPPPRTSWPRAPTGSARWARRARRARSSPPSSATSRRPGVHEVELGTPFADLLDALRRPAPRADVGEAALSRACPTRCSPRPTSTCRSPTRTSRPAAPASARPASSSTTTGRHGQRRPGVSAASSPSSRAASARRASRGRVAITERLLAHRAGQRPATTTSARSTALAPHGHRRQPLLPRHRGAARRVEHPARVPRGLRRPPRAPHPAPTGARAADQGHHRRRHGRLRRRPPPQAAGLDVPGLIADLAAAMAATAISVTRLSRELRRNVESRRDVEVEAESRGGCRRAGHDRDRRRDARGRVGGTLDAQDSDSAAERSAREIQAARDRANAAAQAMFDAESRIDQIAVEIDSTNKELAALEAEVAAFRTDLEEMAVRKFVNSGVGQNPLLTGVEGANDAAAADMLFAVATDSSAVTLDEYEEAGRELDETRSRLEDQRREAQDASEEYQDLQRRAEEEIVRLQEIEKQRLHDEGVQAALAAQRREPRAPDRRRSRSGTPGAGRGGRVERGHRRCNVGVGPTGR